MSDKKLTNKIAKLRYNTEAGFYDCCLIRFKKIFCFLLMASSNKFIKNFVIELAKSPLVNNRDITICLILEKFIIALTTSSSRSFEMIGGVFFKHKLQQKIFCLEIIWSSKNISNIFRKKVVGIEMDYNISIIRWYWWEIYLAVWFECLYDSIEPIVL